MMLSSADLRLAIAEGSLVVKPFSPDCIRPSGLTLHLGENLLKPLPGKVVDVKNKIIPDYNEIKISNDKPYQLESGEFILAHTYETVTVSPKHGFLIEGRSTLARVGLTIVQTAMIVYPGHRDRTITLELANHGPNPILLYPKMKIARVALFELRTPSDISYDDNGKYREQVFVGKPIFDNEFLKE
jgi:dCTP deaminase